MGELIYLDNAATSFPKPVEMHDRMTEFYRRAGVNPGRSGTDMALAAEQMVHGARRRLTELFNESSEPPLSEFSLQEWLDLFPEGEYRFFGITVEGDLLVGVAEFTHDIPEGPEITSPEDEDEVDPDVPLVTAQHGVGPDRTS